MFLMDVTRIFRATRMPTGAQDCGSVLVPAGVEEMKSTMCGT